MLGFLRLGLRRRRLVCVRPDRPRADGLSLSTVVPDSCAVSVKPSWATRVPAADSCQLLVRAGSVKAVFASTFTRQLGGGGCPTVTDGLDRF